MRYQIAFLYASTDKHTPRNTLRQTFQFHVKSVQLRGRSDSSLFQVDAALTEHIKTDVNPESSDMTVPTDLS